MDRLQYTFLDKSQWERGPWDSEPDKAQWPDPKTGLPCLAVRNPQLGHWCGYVGVGPGHKFFGIEYSDIDARLDVHGGVTYTEVCTEIDKEHGVCHAPGPGEPDRIWWIGFDCCHYQDLSPGMLYTFKVIGLRRAIRRHQREDTYRDLAYVRAQCACLAYQLHAQALQLPDKRAH